MSDEALICGHETGDYYYGGEFTCELRPGHAGDHQAVHTWTNEPIGPELPPIPNRFLPSAWAESLYDAQREMVVQQAEAVASGSPFVNPASAKYLEDE